MPNALKWEGTLSKTTVIDLGTTLASDAVSAVGSEYDNQTNLNTYAWLSLATSTGNLVSSAITRAYASADIYMIKALDGTNYDRIDTANLAEFGSLYLASIPLETNTTVVPISVGPLMLPPAKIKFYLRNNSDQTLQNTWQLDLYVNNLEVQ